MADRIPIGIKTSPQQIDWPILEAGWARICDHDVFAVDSVAAGARHVVLSMPPRLGPAGVDAIAREVATPLREALG